MFVYTIKDIFLLLWFLLVIIVILISFCERARSVYNKRKETKKALSKQKEEEKCQNSTTSKKL